MTASFCPFKNANLTAHWMPAPDLSVAPSFPQARDLTVTAPVYSSGPIAPHSPLTSQDPTRITVAGFLQHAPSLHTRLSHCSLCLELLPSLFSYFFTHSPFITAHLCRIPPLCPEASLPPLREQELASSYLLLVVCLAHPSLLCFPSTPTSEAI